MRGKGNKGSRSKYADISKKYMPKRTMTLKYDMNILMKKKPDILL